MLGNFTSIRLLVKLTCINFNQPLVFHIALKTKRNFLAACFFLEAVGAKWGRQQRERPLESKLKWLGGKKQVSKRKCGRFN